jgi:hypothetical protein
MYLEWVKCKAIDSTQINMIEDMTCLCSPFILDLVYILQGTEIGPSCSTQPNIAQRTMKP